jgi:hypothetical protein
VATVTTVAVRTVRFGTGGVRPFAPTSVWNTKIATGAALASDSTQLVHNFNHQWHTIYGTVNVNTDAYSIPIYRVPAGQPGVRVAIRPGCYADPSLVSQLQSVPIPANALPASGGDHSLVIWQPDTDTDWELWNVEQDHDGNWSACWGGRIDGVSRSSGAFPAPYGVAASGLSYLGGALKISELRAGRIEHALAVAVPRTTAGVQVPPATRNDGNSYGSDAIPEGTRFRLDPSVDVKKLGLGKQGVAIARALQTYGMYVTDTSGAVVLVGEDGSSYRAESGRDPWRQLFGGKAPYSVLAHIPWDRLQVMAPPAR